MKKLNWLEEIIHNKTPVVWGENIVLEFVEVLPSVGNSGVVYVYKEKSFIWDELRSEYRKLEALNDITTH